MIMKKFLILTMIAMFAVACGKSGGGGGGTPTNGTYVPGSPTSPNEPYVVFDMSMDICSKGALQIRPGTRMSISAAQDYFADYYYKGDQMKFNDIARIVETRYNPHTGQSYEKTRDYVNGVDIAEYGGSYGYP